MVFILAKEMIETNSWGPVELKRKKGRMQVYEETGLKQY